MKRHVQIEGVRKWAGEDMITLQAESLKILDRFFGQYGSYVLHGCEVTPAGNGLYNVAPGLVVLKGKDWSNRDTIMVVPFAGANGFPSPLYLTLTWSVRRREYITGGVKPIAYDYVATASTVQPAADTPHMVLDNKTARFIDAIQDNTHSFITEEERVRWNSLMSDVMEYVVSFFETFDPTMIGELRQLSIEQDFNDEDYLPCDGSIVGWDDYPGLGIPVRELVVDATTGTSWRNITGLGGNGDLWVLGCTRSNVTGYFIYTSPDLETWTQRSSSSSIVAGSGLIKYIDGVWLVCFRKTDTTNDASATTELNISTDNGVTWTPRQISDWIYDIRKVGANWLCARYDGLFQSPNLSTWTKINLPVNLTPVKGIAHNGGRTVIITPEAIYYSDDLVSWNTAVTPASGSLSSIAYGAGKWIVGTATGNLLSSVDNGVSWSIQTLWTEDVKHIVFGQHVWLANIGKSTSFSYDNGTTWSLPEQFADTGSGQSRLGVIDGQDDFFLSVVSPDIARRIRIGKTLPSVAADDNTRVLIRVKK